VQFDPNLREAQAKMVFFRRKEIGLNKESIYVLRGPKQVGKTTYVRFVMLSYFLL
jgi:predicted AAA+ superfamily ATPase